MHAARANGWNTLSRPRLNGYARLYHTRAQHTHTKRDIWLDRKSQNAWCRGCLSQSGDIAVPMCCKPGSKLNSRDARIQSRGPSPSVTRTSPCKGLRASSSHAAFKCRLGAAVAIIPGTHCSEKKRGALRAECYSIGLAKGRAVPSARRA